MGFTATAWLAALAALSIPLAIHLWSRRRTKSVAIGSIRFLQARRPLSRRTLRLRDPWRLLLRLAMLTAVILALAGPYLTDSAGPPESSPERWVVVSPSLEEAGRGGRTDVTAVFDSVRIGADAVRLLHPAWPPLEASIGMPAVSMDTWSLLLALDQTLPPRSHIDVIAPARTGSVRGSRPALHSTVEWFSFDDGNHDDSVEDSVERAPLTVAIFAGPDRKDDARYLQAAIGAISDAGDSATVRRYDTSDVPDAIAESWIAWLSARPVPAAVVRRVRDGGVLLTDVGDAAGVDVSTSIDLGRSSIPVVRLTRRGEPPDGEGGGAPVWRDGHGVPLLTVSREGAGRHYRLATRLHPTWTSLVLRGLFPEALRPLLQRTHALPDLPMTISQASPAWAGPPAELPSGDTAGRSLFYPMWLLAVVLFLVDAVMSRPRLTA